MIALLPALGEELMFRGVLQRLFHDWTKNIHVSIFLAALVFGLFHLQFYGLLPRVFLGMVLGYLFYWTGSLWVPIFVHFMNNASAVIAAYFESTGATSAKWEDFGSTDNIFLIIGSFLLTASPSILSGTWRKTKGRMFLQHKEKEKDCCSGAWQQFSFS